MGVLTMPTENIRGGGGGWGGGDCSAHCLDVLQFPILVTIVTYYPAGKPPTG